MLCSMCETDMVVSKKGTLYCPNSLPHTGWGTPHKRPTEHSPNVTKFLRSLNENKWQGNEVINIQKRLKKK